MIRTRVFVLGAYAISAGPATLIACDSSEPPTSFVERSDAAVAPEASPSVDHDAGVLPPDAAPPKPDYDASDDPVVCTSTPCVTQLAAGENHFCALLSEGTVRCWGEDFNGSLGRGESSEVDHTGSPPAPVVGITTATQISASPGGATTCARNAGGRVQCWGRNNNGQLGLQESPALVDFAAHGTPADVALTTEIARVDVGSSSVCALSTHEEVYCWGSNNRGQLARPDSGTSGTSANEGPGLADLRNYDVTRVAAGSQTMFGVTKDRQLIGWGAISGRDSSMADTSIPFPLPSLTDVTRVATDGNATHCAIASGSVHCWGANGKGQLGTGVRDTERLPAVATLIRPDDGAFPQQLALARERSCVRMTDGTIQCCGDDQFGQRGFGDAGTLAVLGCATTELEQRAVQVATSNGTTCALVQGGKVMCWGGNGYGELGQGTRDSLSHPIPATVVFQ